MIRIEGLTKRYGTTTVLDGLDFTVDAGEIAGVVGPSGAGKSTLAQCVTLLEPPTSGSIIVNGENLSQLSASRLREARRRIGTVFQTDGLFARRTAARNVALPLEYLGVTRAETQKRVSELLDRVGLADKAGHYPHQLSGGQRQRVGIARALALRPSVLIADEATSGLDPDATASVVALLKELRSDLRLAIVFITHEMDTVRSLADTVARLDHGRIVESGPLLDLLRNDSSELGRALQPRRAHEGAAAGTGTWFVTYGGASVPGDWVRQLGETLGTRIDLLGASIELLHGATVGHATIGIAEGQDAFRSVGAADAGVTDAAVLDALSRLGLEGRRDDSVPAAPHHLVRVAS